MDWLKLDCQGLLGVGIVLGFYSVFREFVGQFLILFDHLLCLFDVELNVLHEGFVLGFILGVDDFVCHEPLKIVEFRNEGIAKN